MLYVVTFLLGTLLGVATTILWALASASSKHDSTKR